VNAIQQAIAASGRSSYCSKCGSLKPVGEFYIRPDGRVSAMCKACKAQYRATKRGSTPRAPRATTAKVASRSAVQAAQAAAAQVSTAPTPVARAIAKVNSDYKPAPDLIATWAAVQLIAADGEPSPNMLFVGPSGSGKTEAARYLAALSGLDFVKVDAPSMTDPEAWFGTREVVVENGSPRTEYHPSAFVDALTRPCVLLIDEVNRVSDAVRNILLALLDATRQVTNPITGQTVVRHPASFILMTGNVGLAFTGTYAIDPAFFTRALTTVFDYLPAGDENRLAVDRTGVSAESAGLFVRFANDTRARHKTDPDFPPISTREVLEACRLVARGLDVDIAAHQVIINAASEDGGAQSVKADLERIWLGIRPAVSFVGAPRA
jgi:MoxR-like ATPase